MSVALKNVYWLVKEGVATRKFSSLVTFLGDIGIDCVRHLCVEDPTRCGQYLSYMSPRVVYDFQQYLSYMLPRVTILVVHAKGSLRLSVRVVEDDVLTVVCALPVLGIMIDETCDITVTEKFDMRDGKVRVFHCKQRSVGILNADNIMEMVSCTLANMKISAYRVTRLGTDGASVMTSYCTGIGKKL